MLLGGNFGSIDQYRQLFWTRSVSPNAYGCEEDATITYSVNLWSMTGEVLVAWIPVAAPMIPWTDETTALAVAACVEELHRL